MHKPFLCASHCTDFPDFELIKTWETGPLLSDSCGYIAVDHGAREKGKGKEGGRIILAFRGTYSLANTIADLSTMPQGYEPYPGAGEEQDSDDGLDTEDEGQDFIGKIWGIGLGKRDISPLNAKCDNCTVHLGFMTSWRHTRPELISDLTTLRKKYPDYQLTLVGHSLGGAVAALASLEFHARGWDPQVTTFGEPRVGNKGLSEYIDKTFPPDPITNISTSYRRITHIGDPVPLLPLSEWGYEMHASEIYISKPDLSPDIQDLIVCQGDADPNCIGGKQSIKDLVKSMNAEELMQAQGVKEWYEKGKEWLNVPPRYRVWQLFWAHRDYFWRLGLCLPRGEVEDVVRGRPMVPEGHEMEEEVADELR